MSSDLFFYTSLDDEDEINSELVVFAEACQAAYEASKPKIHRTPVERDHYGAHDRLLKAHFSENLQYNEKTFREHWSWENCPVAFKAQFCRGDHDPDSFILLEAIASNDLWIWHASFSVSGMNNDVNVLRKSSIFNDLKSGRAPDVSFVANDVPYKRGYYLTDEIYPQWSVLIKSITYVEVHSYEHWIAWLVNLRLSSKHK
uniref:Ribosomal protein n=1 Tax=Tanacetum cinerariifolium TaxID=118510 RepID=A0A699I053_TANCI|nr:ribosomal protein [Tanacetum cinerariifolium]